MYDLRYPINGVQATPGPNHAGHTSTKPYISFPGYNGDLVHTIDINRELGLLASCEFCPLPLKLSENPRFGHATKLRDFLENVALN